MVTIRHSTQGSTRYPQSSEIGARIDTEVRNIGIPPRPTVLALIDQEMHKESPDFKRIADVIGSDVALAASVMKVANSPFFGFSKRVRTVSDALLVLGLKMAANTIASIVLQKMFPRVPNLERFWDSAARSARVSRWLAHRLRASLTINPDDAYTFGLFRDCGIPVLLIPFPEYEDVLKAANQEATRNFTAIEDEALSINHAVVGAELAEDWLLPDEVVLAIRHHHETGALPTTATDLLPTTAKQLIAISQLSEYLIQELTGMSKTQEWPKLGPACLSILKLDPSALPPLLDAIRETTLE